MLILHNAHIHTLDPQNPNATAMAIEQRPENSGRVLALGELSALHEEFPGARLQDLGGSVVLPGLIDAHIHLLQYARMRQKLDCRTATRADCLERVAERAAQSSEGGWILGHGWQQNDWQEGFGDAAQLDTASPRNPVFLTAASLHAAWVNTAALKVAGITADSADPPNGQIQRHTDGRPTGILFEAAVSLVENLIPSPSPTEDVHSLRAVQSELWRFGLTGVHDFDRAECLRAVQTLHERGELKLRVLKSIPVEDLEHALAIGLQSGFGNDKLRIGQVKVFADGALGPRTAALFDPYDGEPGNRGMLFVDSEQLLETAQKAVQGGLAMAVHAIGDRANHEVLDAFEQLREFEQASHLPSRRHRIEHVQLLHPNDVHRLSQLDVIASMQPIHAASDMEAADRYWGVRKEYSYAWRSQLNSGALLAFGSDAPVESPDPWLGIHAAVTRRRANGSPAPGGWIPEQRLSLQDALAGYTQGAAFAAGMENRLGRLAPGYLADLVVLREDPFSVEPHGLQHIRPQATMLGGEWVWKA